MIGGLIRKYRAQLGDTVWSIAGLVLMNVFAQVILYPLLASKLGGQNYGDLQYLMAYVNIITVSVGCAANMTRMTQSADGRLENNGDYHLLLLVAAVLGAPAVLLIRRFGGVEMDAPTTVCYYLLFVAMLLRYYADVSYKLTLRYRRYFIYYTLIGVGYAVGAWLFWLTGIWPLGILVGEALGVLYAYLGDKTLRRRFMRPSPAFSHVARVLLLLCLTEGAANLILNADRLIIKFLVGSAAVTVYYLATLVGKTMSLLTLPLGGVLLGHLAGYQGGFDRRTVRRLTAAAVLAVMLFTGVCMFGGWLMLLWLYPAEYSAVLPFLWIGSLAQVFYFVTGILAVVLLRFGEKRDQLYINGVFALCFFGLGIPATLANGLWGFATAALIANAVRFLLALAMGWIRAAKSEKNV